MKRLRKEPTKVINLPDSIGHLLPLREELKEKAKEIREHMDEVDATILLALGDAEVGNLSDGTRIEHMEIKRKGYTVEATSYRQLRVRKP